MSKQSAYEMLRFNRRIFLYPSIISWPLSIVLVGTKGKLVEGFGVILFILSSLGLIVWICRWIFIRIRYGPVEKPRTFHSDYQNAQPESKRLAREEAKATRRATRMEVKGARATLKLEARSEKELAKRAKVALGKVTRIENEHQRRISNAEEELRNVLDPRGRKIAKKGGVTVYQRFIVSPQGSGSLIGVHAKSEDNTSIRQRLTATRMVALGVFSLAAPQRRGEGTAYVVFEGPEISGVATFVENNNMNAGPTAANFAALINNTARAAAVWSESKERLTMALDEILDRLRSEEVAVEERAEYAAALAQVSAAYREKYSLPSI